MQIHHSIGTAPPPADLDPGFRETLPPVMVGQRPPSMVGDPRDTPGNHELLGEMFVLANAAAGVTLTVSALWNAGSAIIFLDPGKAGVAVGAGIWAAVHWRLSGEVERFSRWGWYGAMAELAAAAAANLWLTAQGNVIVGIVGAGSLVANLLCVNYFWKRREQFGVDVGL